MTELNAGDEVELAPGFDHLYNPNLEEARLYGAYVGCRAKVKEKREDSVGFPHIYVEWNKEDWRYNGMPDGWTFENHFRRVSKPISDPQNNSDLIIRDMIGKAEQRNLAEQQPCPHCGEVHLDLERNSELVEKLIDVEEAVLNSEGFALISIHRGPEGYEGRILSAELSDEAALALEDQIIHLAARLTIDRMKSDDR